MEKFHKPGRRVINLTNKDFGKLTVIRKASDSERGKSKTETYWICICECGNEIAVLGSNLRRGHTKSCGCGQAKTFSERLINLVGKRFGRLIVIKRVPPPLKDKTKKPYWLCKCDCGKIKVVLSTSLIGGRTKSCGCLRKNKETI